MTGCFQPASKQWPSDYIGKRYLAGGLGPDAYDCWGLFQAIQQDIFGRDLPLAVVALNLQEQTKSFVVDCIEKFCSSGWGEVNSAADGDAVVMGFRTSAMHVGVAFNGSKVIHALEGVGVVLSDISRLGLLGFNVLSIWRPKQ